MQTIFKFIGFNPSLSSNKEKLISGLGGFVGIFLTLTITSLFLPNTSIALIVPSFGASAVLLFAIPHGPLSQPWNLIAGHVFSAIVGVSCALLIPNEMLAAALAVGLAITVQYYTHCIHPPGGATALVAVIGGQSIHEMGYMFVLTPILINALAIILVAVIFNYFFQWRRYPAYLAQAKTKPVAAKEEADDDKCELCRKVTHANIVVALAELDSYVDISEEDLLKIYDIATRDTLSKE